MSPLITRNIPSVLLFTLLISPILSGQESTRTDSVELMLAEMKQITEKSKTEKITADDRGRLEELRENMQNLGEKAAPLLLSAIDEEQNSLMR